MYLACILRTIKHGKMSVNFCTWQGSTKTEIADGSVCKSIYSDDSMTLGQTLSKTQNHDEDTCSKYLSTIIFAHEPLFEHQQIQCLKLGRNVGPADSNHQSRSKIQVGCKQSNGLPSLSYFPAPPPDSPLQPPQEVVGGWSAVSPASALAHLPCCHPDCAGLAPKTQQPCACTRPAVHGLSCLHQDEDVRNVRNPGSAHLNDAKKKMHFTKCFR